MCSSWQASNRRFATNISPGLWAICRCSRPGRSCGWKMRWSRRHCVRWQLPRRLRAASRGPARSAASNSNRNLRPVGDVERHRRLHSTCQHVSARAAAQTHAGAAEIRPSQALAYQALVANVGRKPTNKIESSGPMISPFPWRRFAAQVTNLRVFSVTITRTRPRGESNNE